MPRTFLRDLPHRYGVVTRILHWTMAYLLLWQFLTLFGWRLLGDSHVMRTLSLFGPAHGTTGLLVFSMVLPRLAWAMINRRQRPGGRASADLLAKCAHGLMYLLMIVVPGVALLRSYGNGKGFSLWDLQIIPKTGRRIEWLIAPAELLHSTLAWVLASLIAGHVLAALVHSLILRDQVLARMFGKPDGQTGHS